MGLCASSPHGYAVAPQTLRGELLSSNDLLAFHVRMPEEVKQRLEKQAKINGRSLNSEIVDRLKSSLAKVTGGPPKVGQESPAYAVQLPDIERQLLTYFRDLAPEKQLALLSLLK